MVLVIALGSVFAGGQQEADVEYDYVIGKIPYTFEHAYHQAVCREITEYAGKMYNTKAVIIDGESSAEATLAAVENLISQVLTVSQFIAETPVFQLKLLKWHMPQAFPLLQLLSDLRP